MVVLLWLSVACFWCESIGDVSPCEFLLFLVRVGLLSGHLLVKSCLLDLPYVPFVFLTICSLSNFPFWVKHGFWVLIAPVPGICIRVTFKYSKKESMGTMFRFFSHSVCLFVNF